MIEMHVRQKNVGDVGESDAHAVQPELERIETRCGPRIDQRDARWSLQYTADARDVCGCAFRRCLDGVRRGRLRRRRAGVRAAGSAVLFRGLVRAAEHGL